MSVLSILKNRNFAGLIAANTILGSAFPIQMILGALAGLMLAPLPVLATLPASVQTLAGLLAAAPISILMGRIGRRAGFALGGVLTLVGAVAAVLALYIDNFALLCAAHFLMGAGWSAFQYFRFAAGEVVAAPLRPVAISLMLTSLLVAALVGPQLFIVARDALAPVPFAGAYGVIGLVALVGLVPLLAVNIPLPERAPVTAGRFSALAALQRGPVRRAVGIGAVSQGIMAFLMVPTPIAMIACGFSDVTASDVIRWHIVAMFAPSFFTGFLIQRFGAQRIAVSGLVIIVAAAGFAASGIEAVHFYGALMVLGVGWNFGFIGATALLADALADEEKAAVQGINDTCIALASTLASFAAGAVVAGLGWTILALGAGAVVCLALVLLALDRQAAVRA
ncbi:MFS transporter [Gymnodinialimonas hymeniacidonis]|uniref:MFS transporter n=1 Tax=Gymnodinialimonas hymeniacidonis TaxID=3126508 RepID=UPI0034C63F87